MNNLVLTIALPLLGAFLLPVLMRLSQAIGLWLGPIILGYGCWLLGNLWFSDISLPLSIVIGGFDAPYGINLYLDSLALLFAFAVQLLGLICWPYALNQDTARRQA
ncbi:MAG: NADH-quinone oxidoreductase subunit J, partial [Candidatus Thiodiazotropha taylori]|nr:NADH-quinone oxidoreductase subunit J [Candidatus Thiodiazotropha taylori]MCW4304743.1 NADH-quinone oxidoreductase subunit J [Candidatus Thiodiazotropha taylori]